MNPAKIRNLSLAVEATFPRPVAWTPVLFEETASKLADVLGFALQSDQVTVRNSDILYHYDLTAKFFSGNASFTRNADKFSLYLNNAQTEDEQKLVIELAERFGIVFLAGNRLTVQLLVTAHVDIGTQQSRHEYLKRFSPSEQVQLSGAVGYLTTKLSADGADLTRLMIEPSLTFPEALFVSWRVNLPAPEDWKEGIKLILEWFEEAATVYDLLITFPVQP